MITPACSGTKDLSCVAACPVDCIHPHPAADGEQAFVAAEQLYIDPDVCIDCGACVAVCPVEAIYLASDLRPELLHFIALNRAWYGRTQG